MDRMRESIFAVLGDLSHCSFLDLFAGSGIIALEAASRGATTVEAVEMDPLKRKTLLKNVSIAPVRIQCHFMAAELYVKRAKKTFDFVFCDPPFPYQYKWELIEAIARSPLLGPGSRLLLHRPREDSQRDLIREGPLENLSRGEAKIYGRSVVEFFLRENSEPGSAELDSRNLVPTELVPSEFIPPNSTFNS
jgi:16S rRNA (guanine(966)-N(2))-methyltransferase RsmD